MKFDDKLIQKFLKSEEFFTREFMYKYVTLDNLNDYLRIILNEYEADRLSNNYLEGIADSLENLLIFGGKYHVYDYKEDYESKFPDLTSCLEVISILSSSFVLSFSKDDLPTMRACLNPPYEKIEEEKKIKLYFDSKDGFIRVNVFFIRFFELIYGLCENPKENLVVCGYNYQEKKILN